MNFDPNAHLELEYPCEWQYKVIGTNETALHEGVSSILANKKHSINPSKKSSKGKYVSLNVGIVVNNEAERKGILAVLQSHPAVKMVL